MRTMAYKVKEIEGKWYVGKGKSYYPATESETFEAAEDKAMRWEMRDLFERAKSVYHKGVNKGYFDPDCFGDYLA